MGLDADSPAAALQDVPAEPQLEISLTGVHVDFPPGWWEDPSNDVILANGRTLRDQRIDGLALVIATGLRGLLKARAQGSSLVDAGGRPVST